jgi:hypothetical protein
LLPPLAGAGRWLLPGRVLLEVLGTELGAADESSPCCAGACGATKSKRRRIGINRDAQVRITRFEFMASPLQTQAFLVCDSQQQK